MEIKRLLGPVMNTDSFRMTIDGITLTASY